MGFLEKDRIKEQIEGQYVGIKNYYHYTSLSTAWSILENDNLWASHARFSNDSEELSKGMLIMEDLIQRESTITERNKKPLIRFIKSLSGSKLDCYIICFCGSDDKLSQWRGYCRKDGVCFGLAFGKRIQYYFTDNPDQENIYDNLEKVYYIEKGNTSNYQFQRLRKALQSKMTYMDYEYDRNDMEEILIQHIPLIKDPGFREEEEYRLVITNSRKTLPGKTDTPLDFLIRYRKGNELQYPYLRICFGRNNTKAEEIAQDTTLHLYGLPKDMNKVIKEQFPESVLMRLPPETAPYILVGNTSEEVQEEILGKLEEIKKEYFKTHIKELDNISIWFEGHLPIRTITVSPCENQEEVIESFRHYCAHKKYWLKYVVVQGSSIPYRRPKE